MLSSDVRKKLIPCDYCSDPISFHVKISWSGTEIFRVPFLMASFIFFAAVFCLFFSAFPNTASTTGYPSSS